MGIRTFVYREDEQPLDKSSILSAAEKVRWFVSRKTLRGGTLWLTFRVGSEEVVLNTFGSTNFLGGHGLDNTIRVMFQLAQNYESPLVLSNGIYVSPKLQSFASEDALFEHLADHDF